MRQVILKLTPLEPLITLISSITVVLLLFFYLIRKYYRSRKLRLPAAQNFLRSPGQSLLNGLNHADREIMIYFVFLIVVPVYSYAAYISYLYFADKTFDLIEMGLVCLVPLAFICLSLYKMIKYTGQRRRLTLEYDGKIAVGKGLVPLQSDGYYIFHDFPAEDFTIDHIVVGQKGAFIVETIAGSKSTKTNRLQDATVEYNGRVLRFPKGTDSQTVEQTNRRAEWLSKWLSDSIEEPVVVRGIIALPGWYVKRTSAEGIPVVNPKQFASLFQYIQPRMLSEETIGRVVHQLEQECRDIRTGLEMYASKVV